MYSHKYLQTQTSDLQSNISSGTRNKRGRLRRGYSGKKHSGFSTGFSAKIIQANNIPKGCSIRINLINKT